MARKTSPNPWQVADRNFVEIEITHRTDTQMRIEFGSWLRLVVASEEQISLAARLVQTLHDVKGVGLNPLSPPSTMFTTTSLKKQIPSSQYDLTLVLEDA